MAHRAISIRCATIARKTTGTTILVSVQKSLPAWPIFLSRRTNQIVPHRHRMDHYRAQHCSGAYYKWQEDRDLMQRCKTLRAAVTNGSSRCRS
jgi:hypothetical protein